jgi:hypothetical protein
MESWLIYMKWPAAVTITTIVGILIAWAWHVSVKLLNKYGFDK